MFKLDPEKWTDEHVDAIVDMLRERRKIWEEAEGPAKRAGKRTPRAKGASALTLADLEISLDDLDV